MSDAATIVEHTKCILYVENNDIAYISEGELHIHHLHCKDDILGQVATTKSIKTLELELTVIIKGKFDHFMQKEIYEQPESVVNTMHGHVNFNENEITLSGLHAYLPIICHGCCIVFITCSTSYHSCLATCEIFEELTEIPISIKLARDSLNCKTPIFLSQSAQLSPVRPIFYKTHCGVHINAGPEFGVASTKLSNDRISFTKHCNQIIDSLHTLPAQIKKVLELDQAIQELTATISLKQSLLLMGRGYQYLPNSHYLLKHATCLKGALKIEEISYIHSEGILIEALKHSPLILINENMPIILIMTQNSLYPKVQSMSTQITACKAQPIVLCNKGDNGIPAGAKTIHVPKTIDCLQGILNIIPLQLVSYHLGRNQSLFCYSSTLYDHSPHWEAICKEENEAESFHKKIALDSTKDHASTSSKIGDSSYHI
ncbi:hypothetical protein C0995_000620 [Termitomyces sp. Mi166|nr:hypothetical protein C0995_000620 [Termitomyces sp. Mi166\